MSFTAQPNRTESREALYMITRSTGQTITYANAAFARVCGYGLTDIIGSSYMRYVDPSTPKAVLEDIFATLARGHRWEGVMEMLCCDGSTFWARSSISPWYENERFAGTTTIRTNATAREIEHARKMRSRLARYPRLYGMRQGVYRFIGLASPLNIFSARGSFLLLVGLSTLPGLVTAGLLLIFARSASGSLPTDMAAMPLLLSLVTGSLVALAMRRYVVQPLDQAVNTLHLLASGELSYAGGASASARTVDLHRALGVARESLVSMVSSVRAELSNMTDSISQLSAGNVVLAKQSEGQAVSTAEITAGLESLVQSVETTAIGASEAERLAVHAATTSIQGIDAVRTVVACMQEIADSARQMKDVTETIEAIAAQTNLLALNAAVESARAGEHGRGFSVVAKEVRTLSTRASEATANIRSLIGATMHRIEVGQDRVAAAHGAIEALATAVVSVGSLMTQVAARNHEQNGALGEIRAALGDIDAHTQHNAAMVEEASAATQALVDQCRSLQFTAAIFR